MTSAMWPMYFDDEAEATAKYEADLPEIPNPASRQATHVALAEPGECP